MRKYLSLLAATALVFALISHFGCTNPPQKEGSKTNEQQVINVLQQNVADEETKEEVNNAARLAEFGHCKKGTPADTIIPSQEELVGKYNLDLAAFIWSYPEFDQARASTGNLKVLPKAIFNDPDDYLVSLHLARLEARSGGPGEFLDKFLDKTGPLGLIIIIISMVVIFLAIVLIAPVVGNWLSGQFKKLNFADVELKTAPGFVIGIGESLDVDDDDDDEEDEDTEPENQGDKEYMAEVKISGINGEFDVTINRELFDKLDGRKEDEVPVRVKYKKGRIGKSILISEILL